MIRHRPANQAQRLGPRAGWGSRLAFLHTESWSGHRAQRVAVVRETSKRFEIRSVDQPLQLPHRMLRMGESALVPKYAIEFIREEDGA